MKVITLLIVSIIALSCQSNDTKETNNSTLGEEKAIVKPEYELIITENSDNTFGYQLLKDGKLLIDQKTIPAIQGNQGFSSRSDALKIGNFVIQKINEGAFPPTISVAELDSLEVIN